VGKKIAMRDSPNEIKFLYQAVYKGINMKKSTIKPPSHLRAETKKWFTSVLDDYELEDHHIRLLILACESWDRATQARETIAEHGIFYTDRLGSPRKHPAVSVEESARIAFARLVRELSLDVEPPEASRIPGLASNRGY
jgi:P27 family predicted phage terminase small subunit